MNYIEHLHIEGLKRFVEFDIAFNEHLNILVGENEAGKSTILEAIKIVLNQLYGSADKAVLKDLFNVEMKNNFEKNPSIQTLPHIYIELKINIASKSKNAEYFYGENNKSKTVQFGIAFECRFDEELGSGIENSILEGKIPYEYYRLRWTTFAGLPYYLVKRPFKFLAIDTSQSEANSSFNYYNKTLFNSVYDDNVRMSAKNDFRDRLDAVFAEIGLPNIDDRRKFGINDKKVILEAVLSVYEDSISLENRGSGMESLIKTQIALDRKKSKLDVIMIEEPENHLCFSNMNKMLGEISKQQSESQIIIATHSNMIASRLDLRNVIWLSESHASPLLGVDKKIAEFFTKADHNNFLQLLLSTKIILVEGASEYILLPKLYKQLTGNTIEDDKVSIISCYGISYKKYLEIAKGTDKRILVITDNDKNQDKIEEAKTFNAKNDKCHIFMGCCVDGWTWEVCLYYANKVLFDEKYKVKGSAEYLYHGQDYGPVLGRMLNNKADYAYSILKSDEIFEVPKYVKDAIEWLNK